MAKTRSIDTRFWSDNFVIELDPLERYLFLYFLTNEHTNISGIYELSMRTMAFETGIEKEMLLKMLPRFEGKIYYFDGWVVIKNFIRHQSLNPSVKKGIEIGLEVVPDNVWLKIKENESLLTACQSLYTEFPIFKSKFQSEFESKSKLKSQPASGDEKDKIKNPEKKSDVQLLVNYFFELRGWANLPKEEYKKRKIIYGRFTSPAKDLLTLCDENLELAKGKLLIVKKWADSQEISWGIETVFKRWFDLDKLPQEKEKRPRILGMPAYEKNGTWYCIREDGKHLQMDERNNVIEWV